MTNHHHIQDYIHNRLNALEKKRFELALKNDETLRKSYKEHKAINKAFQLNEAERLKAKLKSYESAKPTSTRTINPLFLAIAASILVVVGLTFYFNYFQQNLYEQYFEPYPNVYQPVVRGDIQKNNNAFVYYENQNYIKAQDAFKNLLEKENNPNVRFYYALSFLNANQSEQALVEFKKIQHIDFEFQGEVIWYSALAEIKLEEFDKAKTLLQSLKAKGLNFKTEETENLLETLKDL